MRFKRQVFESRVAWRVFALFVVASLLPLLAFSWLATSRVGAALEEEAFQRLGKLSRNYGQVTLDKLVSVAEAIDDAGSIEARAGNLFGVDAVSVLAGGEERVLHGDWRGSRADIEVAADKPTIALAGGDVVIARRVDDVTVFARVAREFLARSDGLLNAGAEVCLFEEPASNSTPFYCSADEPTTALDAMVKQGTERRLQWDSGGEEWLGAEWQLFLPSRFAAVPWLVVVGEPRSSALGALATLQRVIPQAALLTLALIVTLATAQIRRTLNPLNELIEGTKRIAAREFRQPVRVDPRDEFGTLAGALNGMASELDHQFAALRALAAIDRLILDTTAVEPVIETLFARLEEIIPGATHYALIIDPDEPHLGRLYRPQAGGSPAMVRIGVTDELQDWLAAHRAEDVATREELQASGLPVGDGPGRTFSVAPMAAATPAGALLTVKHDGSVLNATEAASLREFATRVAVAVAASKREAELFQRAHFDALTGLPNRELLHDRLHQAVAQALRDDHGVAVLFIDLDSFKAVNDTHGHPAGDELLRETALRIAKALRPGETVARLGGDEYAILLPNVHGPLEAEAVAVNVIESLSRPFVVNEQTSFVTASIGVAMFPDDAGTATELLRKADMAMYNAKDAGKGCYRFFAEEMDRRIQERHSLHSDLRRALAAREFSLAYHPQRSMVRGNYVAVEALLRWQHPRRGWVAPAIFVPILEESGLIGDVGAWVLRRALTDFAGWRRAGLVLERVAVNVAARQLLHDGFVEVVGEALQGTGVDGSNLEVELTEASLVTDFRRANAALTRLRGLGVRIAVDDFGTGYSSLTYLNELVFDVLKIDRAFVVNLPAPKAVAIVKAIIAVAESLGKEVVAEGIETESQWSQLMALGCHYGQGYLLSKPLGRDEIAAFMDRTQRSIAAGDRRIVVARELGEVVADAVGIDDPQRPHLAGSR